MYIIHTHPEGNRGHHDLISKCHQGAGGRRGISRLAQSGGGGGTHPPWRDARGPKPSCSLPPAPATPTPRAIMPTCSVPWLHCRCMLSRQAGSRSAWYGCALSPCSRSSCGSEGVQRWGTRKACMQVYLRVAACWGLPCRPAPPRSCQGGVPTLPPATHRRHALRILAGEHVHDAALAARVVGRHPCRGSRQDRQG